MAHISDTISAYSFNIFICNKLTGTIIFLQQVQIYYRSGNDKGYCIGAGHTLHVSHQMAALFFVKWSHGHQIKTVTSNWKSDCQFMCIYTKNIPAKFHP